MVLELINVNKHYKQNHALRNFSYRFHNGIYGYLDLMVQESQRLSIILLVIYKEISALK